MNSNNPAELPEPDPEAVAHSCHLMEQIKQAIIANDGNIPFSDYMRLALYTPGLGYYSSGRQKFGKKGDFITAPEVSPLFGQCLARQLEEIFRQMASPVVLEFGAGSGVLAVEILTALSRQNALPEYYYILEVSAELRQRQRQYMEQHAPHLLGRVVWLDSLPEKPINAVVIANEVLDAMPVECFSVQQNRTGRMVVRLEADRLVADYTDTDALTRSRIEKIEQHCGFKLPVGYCSEYNPSIQPWLSALYESLLSAVVLLIDYGYHASEYYHPDRTNGTLMCYYQHRSHSNPLWYPGLQDITAFVDFTDVAYSAVECGFSVSGYTNQAVFLLGNGLSELHAEQVDDNVQTQINLSQQIKTLTLPSEMGERFKVMALTKNVDMPLSGFALQDYRNRL